MDVHEAKANFDYYINELKILITQLIGQVQPNPNIVTYINKAIEILKEYGEGII